jgi:hypothetical protein
MPANIKFTAKIHGKTTSVSDKNVTGVFDDITYKALGIGVYRIGKTARQRNIYLAAIFFQRVVSRTPVDENYIKYNGQKHEMDDDVVRKCWYLEYNGKKIYSRDIGMDLFEDTDDKESMENIKSALDRFFPEKKVPRQIKIYNDNERMPMLEYGTYEADSRGISYSDSGTPHGIEDGFSIQAPAGMLRITMAEVGEIAGESSHKAAWTIKKTADYPSTERLVKIGKYVDGNKKIDIGDVEGLF